MKNVKADDRTGNNKRDFRSPGPRREYIQKKKDLFRVNLDAPLWPAPGQEKCNG